MIRQGDVLISHTSATPVGVPVTADHGRLILARGEATGHHHSIAASAGTLLQAEDGVMYLTVDQHICT